MILNYLTQYVLKMLLGHLSINCTRNHNKDQQLRMKKVLKHILTLIKSI